MMTDLGVDLVGGLAHAGVFLDLLHDLDRLASTALARPASRAR
jgi:hypothetical protein